MNARGLDLDFVQDFLGWADVYYSTPAILIPYRDKDNNHVQTRYRVGLDVGERFRWEKGSKAMFYGLCMLERYWDRGLDYIIMVEGETDFATLRSRGYPVLAVPGASTFQPAWATYLNGFKDIYLWAEPDTGGDTLLDKLFGCVPDFKVISAPNNTKDPTELARVSKDFEQVFKNLLNSAKTARLSGAANVDPKRSWSGGQWVKVVPV